MSSASYDIDNLENLHILISSSTSVDMGIMTNNGWKPGCYNYTFS